MKKITSQKTSKNICQKSIVLLHIKHICMDSTIDGIVEIIQRIAEKEYKKMS